MNVKLARPSYGIMSQLDSSFRAFQEECEGGKCVCHLYWLYLAVLICRLSAFLQTLSKQNLMLYDVWLTPLGIAQKGISGRAQHEIIAGMFLSEDKRKLKHLWSNFLSPGSLSLLVYLEKDIRAFADLAWWVRRTPPHARLHHKYLWLVCLNQALKSIVGQGIFESRTRNGEVV